VDNAVFQFGALAFVSLFAVIDPIGALPVYLSMTSSLNSHESRSVAIRAIITASIVLVAFAILGPEIFHFFNISVNSLRIVGGVIFFIMGYEMLNARLSRTKMDEESTHEYIEDVAITPLGIPMIAGPGAITTVILLMNDSHVIEKQAAVFVAIFAVMLVSLVFLIGARRIMNVLGGSGEKVLMRLMGLIVMAVAVEFFVSGLRPIVQSMIP
jgi:multiple antibiotic resistance protein